MGFDTVSLDEGAYAAAGLVLALFGAWLLYLSPRQRATRALSLLLFGMAVAWCENLLGDFLGTEALFATRFVAPVVYTVIGLSTIYFLSVYPRARGWIGHSRWGAPTFLALGVAFSAAFVIAPDLYVRADLVGGDIVNVDNGPLVLLGSAWTLTSLAMILFFARDLTKTPPGPVRRALLLVLAGFLTSMLTWTGSLVANDVSGRLDPSAIDGTFGRLLYILEEIAFFGALVAAGIVVVHGWRSQDATVRREANALATLVCVALVAIAVATLASPAPGPDDWTSASQGLLDAAGGMAIAVFAGYALLKHRLFDIDVKLRWTISRGTVALVFVGIFFIASQLAQSFLEDSMGWALGGIITGVMLFAITPIQRLAERVAVTAVPVHAAPAQDRRVELYRLALALALSDRIITRDEERHLAKLAEELGVTHTEALGAREEMEREMGLVA